MNIGYEYLNALNTLLRDGHLKIKNEVIQEIAKLLGQENLISLNDCLAFLDQEIKKVDDFRGKIQY